MLSTVVTELPQRAPRVRFKHPVRVVTLDGSPRIYRTLSANLSRKGMFVRMPEPLPKGTRVALSLEAAGQALPFAEAEVVWCRTSESQLPGRYTGIGVRFTSFLNPRAAELVEYLVKNLDRGRPLKLAPPKSVRNRRRIGLAAGILALVVAGGLGARAVLRGAAEDDEFVAPESTSAPVAVAEAASVAMPPEPGVAPPSAVVAAAPEPASAAAEPRDVAPSAASEPSSAVATDAKPDLTKVVDGPPQRLAAAKSNPAQGRLALPSGAAQSLTWEEREAAVHVRLTLAPGVTVGRRFLLAGPPRLVMDLDGRAPTRSHTLEAKASWLERVRIGPHGASTRVVVDLASAPAAMTQSAEGVTLTFDR
jgi:hypothetical protein